MKKFNSTNRGYVIPLVIAVVAILVAGAAYYLKTTARPLNCCHGEQYATSTATPTASSTDSGMPAPHISSISPSSGPIGTAVEIKGNNLAGFEGDLDAVFVNAQGETVTITGLGPVPREDGIIRIVIPSKVCRVNNSYSGNPCTSYLNMAPGKYTVYAMPWGNKSNSVSFTITN